MRRGLPLLSTMLTCLWVYAPLLAAPATPDERLVLLCMPDQDPLDHWPTDAEITAYVAAHSNSLDMTVAELTADPRREFARCVLGQQQIYPELVAFEERQGVKVKVRFIAWPDAFRYYENYASDPANPPVVVHLGDTWAPYFRSLGVMPYDQRHTVDVRLLWYRKDLVSPGEIADGEGFTKVCRRLHEDPPAGLVAPYAISTAPDWDLLHILDIWLLNAGLESMVSSERKLGILPWKQAVFAGPEGQCAAQFLIALAEQGYMDLPEKTNVEVLEDFLAGKYAMVMMGPWVPWRAERKLGPDWQSKIGATLPPKIGAKSAATFKGGSLMVVLDPSRGKDSSGIKRARGLVDFLCSPAVIGPHAEAIAALPGHPDALKQSRYVPLFKDALERGKSHPSIPEWASVVENLATRDSIYAFWKRLSALSDTAAYTSIPKAEQAARRRLVLSALQSAEEQINARLSPGKLAAAWPWLAVICILVLALLALQARHRRVHRRAVLEVRHARMEIAEYQSRIAQMEREQF